MPMIFVELSVITHAEEGIVEGGGADEVELFDLKYFLLASDVPDTNLLLAAGDQCIFLNSLCEENDVLSMGDEL